MTSTRVFLLTFVLSVISLGQVFCQETNSKKVLGIDEYTRWRSVRDTTVSEDGNWVTFTFSEREKDSVLHVKNPESKKVHKIERGSRPKLSDDSKWVAYTLNVAVKEAKKLKKTKKPVINKGELLNLETGDKITWDGVSGLTFSKGSKFLAIKRVKTNKDAKHKGTDLVLRHLDKGYEELIGSVSSFAFNKPGTHLVYAVSAADKVGNGLYLFELNTGMRRPLDNGKADYEKLAWDEEGTAVVVLKGVEDKKVVHKKNTVIVFRDVAGDLKKVEFTPSEAADFPKDQVVSEMGALTFNVDASKVFFAIRKQEQKPGGDKKKGEATKGADSRPTTKSEKKDAVKKPEVANVDVWHWKDMELQSAQKKRIAAARKKTYRGVLNLDQGTFFPLTDVKMESISMTRDGKWGIGSDRRAYSNQWEESKADYYRINAETGERVLIFKGQGRTLGLSPDSKHYLYWKGGHVWLYEIASNKHSNITEKSGVSFVNLEEDHFGTKPAYGVSGWTKDGKSVVLRHRYDLYSQPLQGGAATNLTGGRGAKDEIVFRYIKTDPEAKFIDLSQQMLLSAYGHWTKKSGFFSLEVGKLQQRLYLDKRVSRVKKAKSADVVIFSIQTFTEYPNYYRSGMDFSMPKRFTDANPQQVDYSWGHRILFDYKNANGVRLQGTLAIPDGYEEGQKLPMVVNFYEKNSQNLHRYPTPRYSSAPNFAGYVSNGYLVMQPDIHFNIGRTGDDMLECVEAAVKKCIEMGYVDPERVGLHGHSFSGMGAAYIAMRSKMFAAVLAGAATTNLLNDFNSLWPGGGQDNHRYDIFGQGRYGTNPYDDLELYLDQSPVNHVRSNTTPLMLLHGTADGTVPWIQAVDLFNALRFNGKNPILLSYPGEAHGLRKYVNQIDFQKRLRQFFDHHLKGKPAPKWMAKGRSYLEKEKALKANKTK
ncbi:MAG: dipeptidyl aminopeptidase/acylaminoacyl peptidase [Planctomycetota bacterium]|jgi:dipeptidyl aminopeptidase/acylaminoacyl peptidase